MGGCRCYFRDCHTNNPKYSRLHFFRFPIKDVERFKKWRQYAKTENMMEFSEMRRKNMNICARHFRAEHFMNYRMDRLTPNAIPTLMRLSKDQALDYELDIENGVLVSLEKPKLKHLIPPDDFVDVLHLEEDNILREKLNELQRQQLPTDDAEYVASGHDIEYEEVLLQKPVKNLVNTVEILETIQVKGPNLKRPRETADVGTLQSTNVSANNSKKCKILNTNKCIDSKTIPNRTTIVLDSCELANSDIIDFVETEEIQNNHELSNDADDEAHFLLTTDDFNLEAENEQEQQLVEIHNTEHHFQYDLTSSEDPDTTVVQLKRNTQNSMSDMLSRELELAQNEISELQIKLQDYNSLQTKISLLETENTKLQDSCQENVQMKNKLLSLQKENNSIKKTVHENKSIKEKLQEYSEENKKLKEECASIDILRAEILSRQQETKELKKLLESLKSSETKYQQLLKEFEMNLETERNNNLSHKMKLEKENSMLTTKLETAQQETAELKKLMETLKSSQSREQELIKEFEGNLAIERTNNLNNKMILQEEILMLKTKLESAQQETKELKNLLETLKSSQTKEQQLIKELESNLANERAKNLSNKFKLTEEISMLKTKVETTQQKLVYTENELEEVKTDLNSKKIDNSRLTQIHEELQQSLNNIQNNFDVKQNDLRTLKSDYDNLQQKYCVLEQKYWKLQALHNQEATVSTSLENTNKQPATVAAPAPAITANSLTKAQLFNGIKRYLSASMVSLLRMEMFGSSDREWKTDERQVAVDILRLGETVYKYFTDEWRFRLPSLRDVRIWLSQSQNMMDDEEDL
ncbi:hypothetical protein FF38_05971 [Lucilia cuprina]|uniref:THAP-type domain-containing protein n=1 Tax=Lucilia cuprina TaxID=7375 RepID=A0A0L0CPP1_LUCCU|nr:hypothetical protein CVS40_7540 [Lucilia cuprina]KNC34343.1 hypothetical protein FF38_05971 [Lucilia cuprina]